MSWRDGTPNDPLYSVRSRGLDPYPTEEERDAWEQKNGLDYYQGKPLSKLDRNWRSEEERYGRKVEVKLVGNPRRQETSLVPLPFEKRMEATFAASVNMLALQINSVDSKEHLVILDWITERLKLLIDTRD